MELPSKAGYPRIRIWDGTLTRVVPGRLEAMQPCLRWGKQQMCSINPLPRDGQRVAWDYVPVAFFEIWSFKDQIKLEPLQACACTRCLTSNSDKRVLFHKVARSHW